MKNIIVTGGSGKAGRAVCRDLAAHGHRVLNIDHTPSAEPVCAFYQVDLSDHGQVIDALGWSGDADHPFRKGQPADAIVHLAAIPAPDLRPEETTFKNNIMTSFNVFDGAVRNGVKRIVWASSETILGLPFNAQNPPAYVPVDENHPMRPESAYALSKDLGEEMARQFHRWHPDFSFIGLRLSNVMEPHDYKRFLSWQDDFERRKWNVWGYIDARDCAQAVRKAIEVTFSGADHFIIANADTVMEADNAILLEKVFPGVEIRGDVGPRDTLLCIDKARKTLGFDPQFSWRDQV